MSSHNKTWLSTWPPRTYGEGHKDMRQVQRTSGTVSARIKRLLSDVKLILILGGTIGIGVLLVFASTWIADHQTWSSVVKEVGSLIIVAGSLGVVIDLVYRQKIVKDVFEVSLGYVLYPQLKDEIRWIYELQFLAEQHSQRYTIEDNGDGSVLVNVYILRIIKNITDAPQELEIGYDIDEWGIKNRLSRFNHMAYQRNNEQWKPVNLDSDNVVLEHGALRLLPHTKVILNPNDELRLTMDFTEVKHRNDAMYISFPQATRNPVIEIERIDENLDYRVWFGHRRQAELKPSPDKRTYQLHGTILPTQQMVIRWWPNDDERNAENDSDAD